MGLKMIEEIVGCTIVGVVGKESNSTPHSQVFLVFADGSSYELYTAGSEIRGGWMLGRNGIATALGYMPENQVVVQFPMDAPEAADQEAG